MRKHLRFIRRVPALVAGLALAVSAAACNGGSMGSTSFAFDGGPEGGLVRARAGADASHLQGGGDAAACTPRTCAQLHVGCGPQGDGCGGVIQCGTCEGPKSCGGGPTRNECGGNDGCKPATCAGAGATCGPLADGCGGLLQCGTCPAGEGCGGGGEANVCGVPTIDDAGDPCRHRTCVELGVQCGPAGDGCGNAISCGACVPPQTCGGGGTPSVCGGDTGCVPLSCAQLGATCGPVGDGCGDIIQCGSCGAPATCGGGGTPSRCGVAATCTPGTCASLGYNCGAAGDGCGGPLSCGSCTAPQVCGGGGQPNVCGPTTATCTNLCLQQSACGGTGTTALAGTVYAPNGTDPLYGALVYVPNAPIAPFKAGVACQPCGEVASGSPLVQAITGADGKFTLTNVPSGVDVPLVIQLGRWRRQVLIPGVTACATNTLPACTAASAADGTCLTSMPTSRAQGDIPRIAVVTGSVDALECVFRKIGLADSEFGDPGGPNRLQIFTGAGAPGASYSATTPGESALWGSPAVLDTYDMVLLACQGEAVPVSSTAQAAMTGFANAGGRVFATHYNYTWLATASSFATTASWHVDQPFEFQNDPGTGIINQTFPEGAALASWLQIVGASTTPGQIAVDTLRRDFDGVSAPSNLWISVNDPNLGQVPLHYSFQTPVGTPAANQCGRVVFEDYHVENATTEGKLFPKECASGPMTPQEKLLEFELFDLASCIGPSTTPVCVPMSCSQQGFNCGAQGDGCGNPLDCGSCAAPALCGGGGTPGVCGGTGCVPKTCASAGVTCGVTGDGCGNVLSCGTCPAGEACGADGTPGKCGPTSCVPQTCASQHLDCGPAGDGCGGALDCGTCGAGESCGAGAKPGVCAPIDGGWCSPLTCASLKLTCGPAGDGCGGQIACGTCPQGQACGAGGALGQCGVTGCKSLTCAAQHVNCGPAGDGCGGQIECGTCTAPATCGGGGVPGQCGTPATAR